MVVKRLHVRYSVRQDGGDARPALLRYSVDYPASFVLERLTEGGASAGDARNTLVFLSATGGSAAGLVYRVGDHNITGQSLRIGVLDALRVPAVFTILPQSTDLYEVHKFEDDLSSMSAALDALGKTRERASRPAAVPAPKVQADAETGGRDDIESDGEVSIAAMLGMKRAREGGVSATLNSGARGTAPGQTGTGVRKPAPVPVVNPIRSYFAPRAGPAAGAPTVAAPTAFSNRALSLSPFDVTDEADAVSPLMDMRSLRRADGVAASCGLPNVGNTCYMNSVLQAVFHTPALLRVFVDPLIAAARQAHLNTQRSPTARPQSRAGRDSGVEEEEGELDARSGRDAPEQRGSSSDRAAAGSSSLDGKVAPIPNLFSYAYHNIDDAASMLTQVATRIHEREVCSGGSKPAPKSAALSPQAAATARRMPLTGALTNVLLHLVRGARPRRGTMTQLKSVFAQQHEEFDSMQQQDASEFWTHLLMDLQDEWRHITPLLQSVVADEQHRAAGVHGDDPPPPRESSPPDAALDSEGAAAPCNAWPLAERADLLRRTTQLTVRSKVRCVACGYSRPLSEACTVLSVGLPTKVAGGGFEFTPASASVRGEDSCSGGDASVTQDSGVRMPAGGPPWSLADLIRWHFKPAHVQMSCDQAGCSGQHVRITYEVQDAPRVLCVHIKRFEMNAYSATYSKRRDAVRIPPRLNLRAVCAGDVRMPPPVDVRDSMTLVHDVTLLAEAPCSPVTPAPCMDTHAAAMRELVASTPPHASPRRGADDLPENRLPPDAVLSYSSTAPVPASRIAQRDTPPRDRARDPSPNALSQLYSTARSALPLSAGQRVLNQPDARVSAMPMETAHTRSATRVVVSGRELDAASSDDDEVRMLSDYEADCVQGPVIPRREKAARRALVQQQQLRGHTRLVTPTRAAPPAEEDMDDDTMKMWMGIRPDAPPHNAAASGQDRGRSPLQMKSASLAARVDGAAAHRCESSPSAWHSPPSKRSTVIGSALAAAQRHASASAEKPSPLRVWGAEDVGVLPSRARLALAPTQPPTAASRSIVGDILATNATPPRPAAAIRSAVSPPVAAAPAPALMHRSPFFPSPTSIRSPALSAGYGLAAVKSGLSSSGSSSGRGAAATRVEDLDDWEPASQRRVATYGSAARASSVRPAAGIRSPLPTFASRNHVPEGGGLRGGGRDNMTSLDRHWQCRTCTFLVPSHALVCSACATQRFPSSHAARLPASVSLNNGVRASPHARAASGADTPLSEEVVLLEDADEAEREAAAEAAAIADVARAIKKEEEEAAEAARQQALVAADTMTPEDNAAAVSSTVSCSQQQYIRLDEEEEGSMLSLPFSDAADAAPDVPAIHASTAPAADANLHAALVSETGAAPAVVAVDEEQVVESADAEDAVHDAPRSPLLHKAAGARPPLTYHLTAVVRHIGSNAGGGHYVTLAAHDANLDTTLSSHMQHALTRSWLCDDARSTPAPDAVLSDPRFQGDAYILYYSLPEASD